MARVLSVEDDDINRDMLSRRLARAGHEVLQASSAARGIEVAHEQSPDVILMDLRLPDFNGWEAARILKSAVQTRHIALIALTAHAMDGDRDRALAAGCDDYDIKPVELARLLDKIRKAIERHRGMPPGEDFTGPQRPLDNP